jgi:hypothetical protein
MRSSRDRFDLKGCKVIKRESCIADVAAALEETSMFKSWCLSNDDVMSIAAVTVDSLLTVGFAVEHIPLDGTVTENLLLFFSVRLRLIALFRFILLLLISMQLHSSFIHLLIDSQPQDELLNHEIESDEPGYNMTEICEVTCSSVSRLQIKRIS